MAENEHFPYLSPIILHNTRFPTGDGNDVATMIRLIEERWTRFYPVVYYTPMVTKVTPVTGPQQLSGESGSTKFDVLWGEVVPKMDTTWRQPHQTGGGVAVDPAVFAPEVPIHARIQRTIREDELKKFGFDRVRNLIVTFPTSLLDKHRVTVRTGDRFRWNNERFEVIQHHIVGWWKNTTVKLFVVVNAQNVHQGS